MQAIEFSDEKQHEWMLGVCPVGRLLKTGNVERNVHCKEEDYSSHSLRTLATQSRYPAQEYKDTDSVRVRAPGVDICASQRR